MAIVTVAVYARMRKCSPTNISYQIRSGIISPKALVRVQGFSKPRIDTTQADLDIAMRGDPQREASAKLVKSRAPVPVPADAFDEDPPDDGIPEIEEAETIGDSYRDAKVSTETLKARKLELDIATREGKLLDAEQVRKRITKLVSETRDAIMNVPAKVAPILVSITDPVEMETRLTLELNEALANFARLER